MTLTPGPQVFRSAGGARVFRLPLVAFPNLTTYVYLVQVADMLALVDAGSGAESSNADLEAGFEHASLMAGSPLRIRDLTHILVTHGHIDHYGGIAHLRSRTGAQVFIHELDRQILTHHEQRLAILSRRLETFLIEAGIPDDTRLPLMQLYIFTKGFYRSTPVNATYGEFGMRVGPFDALHIPGHCPGQVALRLHDLLFVGDHLLAGIIPHQSPEGIVAYAGLGHYLDSLASLQRWAGEVSLVFTGHDEPIRALAGRSQAIREEIGKELERVQAYLAEPHTVAETTVHLYGEIKGYNSLLVVEKTGAFIEYLYQRGLLEIANIEQVMDPGSSTPLRYRRSASQLKF
ncbi:MAG: MBL fold metallo-hydrolase [Chloroflexi bacterium]|nr:MBL fold metallo-hydrolase [Chloroflexota bacterium]